MDSTAEAPPPPRSAALAAARRLCAGRDHPQGDDAAPPLAAPVVVVDPVLEASAAKMTVRGYAIREADLERLRGRAGLARVLRLLTVQARARGRHVGRAPDPFPVFHRERGFLLLPRHFARAQGLPAPSPAWFPVERCEERLRFEGALFEEQREPVARAIEAIDSVGGGVLSLPTGGGKTTVALALACHYGVKTLIVVHNTPLLSQWRARIAQFVPGARVGRIQGKDVDVRGCDIVVAMIQSLSSKAYGMDVLAGFGLLVVDECHHLAAQTFSKCMLQVTQPRTLGLSATPAREDGLTHVIEWFLGPLFFRREPQFGRVHVRALNFCAAAARRDVPYKIPKRPNGDVDMTALLNDVCFDKARNRLIAREVCRLVAEDPRRFVIVLSQMVQHCKDLADELRRADPGMSVGLYVGSMKPAELAASTGCRVMVGTYSLAGEGLDVARLNTLVIASPRRNIEQVIGRIMRAQDGVPRTIVDLRDGLNPLMMQFKVRKELYARLGFEVEMVAAPS